MSQLAITLQRDYESVEDTLRSITDATLSLVPSATDVSVSLVIGRRRVQSRAATSTTALEIDRLQDCLEEGPCLDAVWTHQTIEVPDLGKETRWPRFAPAAAALGVRSMLCFQLYTLHDNLGALNLSSTSVDAFDGEARQTGTLVATHAAVALIAAEHEHQMQSALASRDVIGQAKGIVMERYDVSAIRAFDMIRKLSQDWNITVAELARTIANRSD
ncbi:GAF and ANTAR domain-containing protein [Rhodococcus sp. BGS-1C]